MSKELKHAWVYLPARLDCCVRVIFPRSGFGKGSLFITAAGVRACVCVRLVGSWCVFVVGCMHGCLDGWRRVVCPRHKKRLVASTPAPSRRFERLRVPLRCSLRRAETSSCSLYRRRPRWRSYSTRSNGSSTSGTRRSGGRGAAPWCGAALPTRARCTAPEYMPARCQSPRGRRRAHAAPVAPSGRSAAQRATVPSALEPGL